MSAIRCAACALFASSAFLLSFSHLTGWAAEPSKAPPGTPEPVEDDMHEFMEYVFQPNYGLLKKSLAKAPTTKEDWFHLKAGSLVLAEGGNLILLRGPEEDREEWIEYATAVRNLGGKTYRAAQSQDFKAARSNYEAMITKCNACHQHYADGEHQLTP